MDWLEFLIMDLTLLRLDNLDNTIWLGSVNDARVFCDSNLSQKFGNGWEPYPGCYLLADSGYTNTNYILTPLLNCTTDQEEHFNRAHKTTRQLIECAIGVLLQQMHLDPISASKYFSTMVRHIDLDQSGLTMLYCYWFSISPHLREVSHFIIDLSEEVDNYKVPTGFFLSQMTDELKGTIHKL
uniref:DDE Tnp4 domain-containing protein n=1 Tax=Romanomermis culicivorax TaxID=13658 RepID=A0A915JGZ6_ROMCU